MSYIYTLTEKEVKTVYRKTGHNPCAAQVKWPKS